MSEEQNKNPEEKKEAPQGSMPSSGPSESKPSQPSATPTVKPITTSKPAPPRPAPARPVGKPQSESKRHFIFSWLGLAWVAFAAATAGALGTTLRFLFPNVLFEPKSSFKIGKPEDYEVGQVDLRWKAKYGVWVVKTIEGMYALSTVCTHLGCTPSWLEGEQKFKCPCHGSGFYKSGIHFEGPAPRPLERYAISLADDGQVLVDKSKKFQQEKGEWNYPESFLYF